MQAFLTYVSWPETAELGFFPWSKENINKKRDDERLLSWNREEPSPALEGVKTDVPIPLTGSELRMREQRCLRGLKPDISSP